MVTYRVTEMITCSPMIGQFFDTLIVASTDRVVKMTYQNHVLESAGNSPCTINHLCAMAKGRLKIVTLSRFSEVLKQYLNTLQHSSILEKTRRRTFIITRLKASKLFTRGKVITRGTIKQYTM